MKRSIIRVIACVLGLSSMTARAALVGKEFADKQELHVGNGAEPKALDPAIVTGVPEAHIIENIFEGLTSIDPFNFEVVPGVAESWQVSSDAKTYTFKIRNNAKWSDGKDLTAQDFVWSWQRVLNPKTASEYAYQLYYVKNGEAYNQGKIKDANEIGVKATDAHTLVVELQNPTPFFLRLTAFHTLFPTPKHVIEKFTKEGEWTKPENLVSNGAFKLAEWKINSHIKLLSNDQYWDKVHVKLKEIMIHPTENVDTEEKTFTAGDLHMTATVPTMKVPYYEDQLKKNPTNYSPYKSNPYLGIYFYRFNVTKKPLDDVRVRKALTMTVDRKMIVERVTRGGQIPAASLTPPNTAGYTFPGDLNTTVTPEVIAQAKRLLLEAGYPEGKGMPKLEILYNTNEGHKKIAIALQQMWKKNLGIEIELYNEEWKVYLDTVDKLNYSLARAGWIGDYPDPNTFLDMFVTKGGNNKTGWSNPKYDQFIRQASQTANQAERFSAFQNAEKILMEELPIIPIYVYTQQKLVSEKVCMVKNNGEMTPWTTNITDRILFKHYALLK